MALLLIGFGFEPHKVYYEMGIAEFNYHFVTAIKLLRRAQQIQASTLIGTIGTFFVKSGEKTIIEMLQEDIEELAEIFVEKTPERDNKKIIEKGRKALNNLLSGMSKLPGVNVINGKPGK